MVLRRTSVALLSTLCVVGLLSGCSQSGQKTASADKNSTADSKTASTDTSTDTASGSADKGASSTGSGTTADSSGSSSDASKSSADSSKTATATNGVSTPQVKVSLDSLPRDLTICTVAGSPITVNDYRRMLMLQKTQMQANIAVDPALRMTLLEEAKKQGLTLTGDEKSKLLAAAKGAHKGDMAQFLKEQHLTQQQFDDQVFDAGLIMKAANATTESNLLPQLVSRELLCKAAKSQPGFEKEAVDTYAKMNKQSAFGELRKQTGLSQDDLRAELVKGELAKLEMEKIGKKVTVSDREIKNFYEANKKQLQHPERVRLSSILVACPEQDIGPVKSVRAQVQQANPKLTGKDLDATVAQVITQQQNKALILLGEAKAKNADFAKLANENSDDLSARIKKTGGDMGWQTKQSLVPQFVDAIWGLKPGTVLEKVVKTNEGFRIMKVTGHEPAGTMPLKDVREPIVAKLKQDKLAQAVNQFVAEQQHIYRIDFSPSFLQKVQGSQPTKAAAAPTTATR